MTEESLRWGLQYTGLYLAWKSVSKRRYYNNAMLLHPQAMKSGEEFKRKIMEI